MATINITVTPSTLQLLAGIPKFVTVSADIPSSIFFTLNGIDPDTNSDIYTSSITLPTNKEYLQLKLFATNGSDSSEIVTKIYSGTIVGVRQGHATVTNAPTLPGKDLYPFSDMSSGVTPQYGTVGGITVDSSGIANIPDGYDGTATGTAPGGTDKPLSDYDLIYSTTDAQGQRGHGIGTLPHNVTIRISEPINTQSSSNMNDKFFNPKSLVIYQDNTVENPEPNIPQTNKYMFSMENPEKVRNGATLYNTAFDGTVATGGMVRSDYNPRDNTITFSYFESSSNRWVFSKEPYISKSSNLFNYAQIIPNRRGPGSDKVFAWHPFVGRKLV